ncbi:MAG: DUF2019 domain-containing protein [Roseiarcus sp.]|jgi:HEAT repeat protein
MSADNYAAMTTERLLALFVEAAKKTGAGSGLFGLLDDMAASVPPEKARSISAAPEAKAAVQALGAALRGRKPIAQIRQLFEDDDRDVRTCAAGQFGSIDPEWAAATWKGLFAKLPTSEVLAFMARARQAPPDRPTLKEMPDDGLVARFEDAATRQYATQFLDRVDNPEDMATHNRISGEVVDVMKELKSRGALARLLPLLANPNMTVRRRAAQGCLRLAQDKAVAALDSVVASGSFHDRVAASDTLDHWRKGKCLVDGL